MSKGAKNYDRILPPYTLPTSLHPYSLPPYLPPLSLFDSHCHLGWTATKLGLHSSSTLQQLVTMDPTMSWDTFGAGLSFILIIWDKLYESQGCSLAKAFPQLVQPS